MQDPTWPATALITVTPSDVTVYSPEVRQIYVGNSGDVSVTGTDNVTVVFKNVIGGSILGPFFIRKINATLTTATNMVAFT